MDYVVTSHNKTVLNTRYFSYTILVPNNMLNTYHRHWLTKHLIHWVRLTHICVGKLTIIGSDNGLSPERRQAIIWNNAGIFLIRALGTNLSEILIEIQTFSLKKMHLKMSSGKRRPSCPGLKVLTRSITLYGVTLSHCHNKSKPWDTRFTHVSSMLCPKYINVECIIRYTQF